MTGQTPVRSSTLTPTVASAGKAHFNTGTYETLATTRLPSLWNPSRKSTPVAHCCSVSDTILSVARTKGLPRYKPLAAPRKDSLLTCRGTPH